MNNLPAYVSMTFISIVIATFGFIYFFINKAKDKNKDQLAMVVSVFLAAWLFVVAILSINEFFLKFDSMPPRFLLMIIPPLLAIALLFYNDQSRAFIKNIPITTLTYIHIIRVPVEIVLWWLFSAGLVPKMITFEGGNYDILSGVSAPFVAIFMVGLRSKSRISAIIWNFIALALLINVVEHAILSTPTPIQLLSFDSPNTAVFYFPFVWLPAFVVPAVLFAHIASLVKLFAVTDDVK